MLLSYVKEIWYLSIETEMFMDKHDVWVCFPCEQIALLFFLVEALSYCSMWALPNDTAQA